jgi:hypothetical protein
MKQWCGETHATPSTEKVYVNQQVTHFDAVSDFDVENKEFFNEINKLCGVSPPPVPVGTNRCPAG